MLTNKYVDSYIERYKNGEILLNKKRVKLLEFLEREILPRDDIYYFDEQQISDYIEFSETWYFSLDEWEKFLVPFIFLFDREYNEVVFEEFVIIVGRGAGKNGFISTLSHYFISSLHGIESYDITLAANSERQAKRSAKDVRLTITKKGHETLNAHPPEEYDGEPGEFEAYKSRITSLETQSEILYVAANSSTLDGGREGAVIYDEFHEMENSDIVDVLSGGLGKTQWGRQFFIGTKGFVRGGYFDNKYNRCEAILNGEEEFNGIFPFICELDEIEEMDNPDNWEKSNPVFSKPLTPRGRRLLKKVKSEYTELLYEPSKRAAFVTKRMNFIEGDLEHNVASQEELMATNRPFFDLKGLTPIGSLDFGSVRDFAACGLLFKNGDEYAFDTFSFAIKHFVDVHYGYSNSANSNGGGKKAPIKEWEKQGLMKVIDEPSLDPTHIVEWFVKARELYGVQKIVADNFKLDILRPMLEKEGFIVDSIKRPQSIHPLIAPRIEDGFANHKFIFGDNPLMRWYTNNVFVKETTAGKLFLKKEEVKRKTDGFQALVHALYRANEFEEKQNFILSNIDW